MAPFVRLASIAAALLSATLILCYPCTCVDPSVFSPRTGQERALSDPRLLDILKERGVKATFFVHGHNIGDIYQYGWVVKRAYREGHQIASHTWAHADLATLSYDQINTQMTQLDNALKSILGVRPVYMRPPYGNLNSAATDYLNDHGYKIVKWRVDTNDWAHPHDTDASLSAYKRAGGSGFIALEHDTYESTVSDLVPRAIECAKIRGWELVTVGECLGVSRDGWYRS
ncbi:hypothetical protein BGW39_007026 [Mortierella sp. 14UC]|nr:hypothetical protein BGW39_007026 [Mortierella sp. 14UC]